ncbi:MAG: dihydrolipoamide acetyltransferase, partial [Deltaproteobacteria bacterium]|nr:dihydrolipoamide acetyltransferase [Deltaproteobacteria bacterium]
MPYELKMPQLSDTMHAGKILHWHKQEGEAVALGDILAEVETDKANLEIECSQQGTLLKIIIAAGEQATVGEAIAYIGQAGEECPATENPPSSAQAPTSVTSQPSCHKIKASPLARKMAAQHNLDLAGIVGSGPDGRIVRADIENAISGAPTLKPAVTLEAQAQPVSQTPQAPLAPGRMVPYSK